MFVMSFRYFFLVIFCFFALDVFGQVSFKCFDSDTDSNLKISVEYSGGQPMKIQYRGQNNSMKLEQIKGSLTFEDGTATYSEAFNEILEGRINGKYTFTHSGNWDYISYQRKDGRVFRFTINLDESLLPNGGGFRSTPCY